MAEFVNKRIGKFYGLNNALSPASAEFAEGTASRAVCSRIDSAGRWTAQASIANASGITSRGSPFDAGGHYKNLAVDDVNVIIEMAVATICDVGPNKKLYGTTGAGAVQRMKADYDTESVVALTPPTIATAPAVDDEGTSRAESGRYYYMFTLFDTVYKKESLPSIVYYVDLDKESANKCVVCTIPAPGAGGNQINIYRSRVTDAASATYNASNIFYYVGKKTAAGAFYDYMHDKEIVNYEFEGRGSAPPSAVDCLASFNNRMLYLKGNVLYWSSAGRPEEVALEYTLTYSDATTVPCKPKLSIGSYGEAKYEIPELSGQKVLGAQPFNGKLWVWTADLMGFIEPTNRLEGYRFRLKWHGVGLTSDKTLALSPYGLFGADRKGIWLFNGESRPKRLTDGRIDIDDDSKDTYLTNANRAASFGSWVPNLNEYWWGISGKIIAYQADRDAFAGPYNYALGGLCSFTGTDGFGNYPQNPSATGKDTQARTLEFWMGQSTPTTIKEEVTIEVVHSAAPTVTAAVIQNAIPSETGKSGDESKALTTAVCRVSPKSSGRMFRLLLTSSTAATKLETVNYRFKAIPWSKDYGR